MANIAFLVDNFFEQVEMTEPRQRLEDLGHQVTLISTGEKTVQGLNHVDLGDTFDVDLMLKNASAADFDALVLPGGTVNADNLRVVEEAQAFVRAFAERNKPLAAICHAPWVLVSSRLARGRTLTGYHTIKDDLINAGADYLDQKVCIDNNLITSRCPDDIPAFVAAIHEALAGTAHIHDRARSMS
jgi:protease I